MDMKTVTVMDMAAARDRRAENQRLLLERFQRPAVSFTLNIPGPLKVFPHAEAAYFLGCRQIRNLLFSHDIPILGQLETLSFTGYEMLYSADAEADKIKRLTVELEDSGPLGRLFDIDVIEADGTGLSREALGLPGRSCLLCSRPAKECGRSRAHTVDELLSHIHQILEKNVNPTEAAAARMENLVIHCLISEVETTPKPGLVDLRDSGAHKDMDYFTFAASAYAVSPFLADMYRAGLEFGGDQSGKSFSDSAETPAGGEEAALFSVIRVLGREAEAAMTAATNGINTHKGAIFSMGILMAALGLSRQRGVPFDAGSVLELSAKIASPAILRDLEEMKKRPPKTHGERLYRQYGTAGIRGEVLNGFPSVRSLALPALRDAAKRLPAGPQFWNHCLLHALLALMTDVEDTNILIRSDMDTLDWIRRQARGFMERGGIFTPGGIARLEEMNRKFIEKNISPGGCADLLSITLLLYLLEIAE